MTHQEIDPQWLHRRYVVERAPVRELEKELGCSNKPILKALHRRGWARPRAEWKGAAASYSAKHKRLRAARGPAPKHCSVCGSKDDPSVFRYEWANLTGNYDDVNDFVPMCMPCHRAYDASRRRDN